MFIVCLSLIFVSSSCFSVAITDNCDDAAASEQTRIYYVNGMMNKEFDRNQNYKKLKGFIGENSTRSFRISVNESTWVIPDFFQVMKQKGYESSPVWEWLSNISIAPQAVKDAYAASITSLAAISYSTDNDLRKMVVQYLRDLRSGKKIVLVSHSQGNFYANKAYRYIYDNFPNYRNSIGIVAVGTPAARVEDGGGHTTNSLDLVINSLRMVTSILDATGIYVTSDVTGHSFRDTYLTHYESSSQIRSHIYATIARLTSPSKPEECDPAIPVIVKSTNATHITITSATLLGTFEKGTNASARCEYEPASSGDPASCESLKSSMSSSGIFKKGDGIQCTVKDLVPDTNYKYRMCAREGDYVYDGGLSLFKTPVATNTCDQAIDRTGGTEGLSLIYYMGYTAGTVNVTFEPYTIPDKFEIWQNGVKRLYSPGYVSTTQTGSFYYNPNNGAEFDVRVYGNSNTGTAWDLEITCPN